MKHIFGHRNPDTDTVCSAIAYETFLTEEGVSCKAYTLGKINNETKYILRKFGVKPPKKVKELPHNSEIILVDHNEEGQSIDNINNMEIVEIIDHHKVKLETDRPIKIQIEPLGSSCSIIAKKYFEKKIKIPKKIASLMIAGIISDTLFFRSPTTTNEDKKLVRKLNKIAGINNLEKFSLKMFDAKSDVKGLSIEELVALDYKEYDFNGRKYGLGVMETTNIKYGLKIKDEIIKRLIEVKRQNKLAGVFFSIIDILQKNGYTLCSGEKEEKLFFKLFKAEEKEGALFVDKIVSRKKQLVPVFEKYFKSKKN